jgi:tetratricopeptide (TPR) repeat protein
MADMKSEKEQLSTLENLFQQKRFSDALEVAKKANSDYPNSFQIKFLYVRTLKELNKMGEAEEVLKELMLIYPNNINLLLESGNLAVLQNKFDEGNEYYHKILFLDPFNTEAKNSIEKINIIKKNGLVKKGKLDFNSYQNEKLQSADTLPEFDSRKLRDIISEEEPPPPPPPPPVPEMREEPPSLPPPPVAEMDTDETEAVTPFQEKIQEQENDVTEIPPPISNMEEIGEYEQTEHQEQLTVETVEPPTISETRPREKLQEQEPGVTVTPSPIPDVPDIPDIPDVSDVSDIPETPIEMEQVMESQEPKEEMEKAGEAWEEETGTEETGFFTESAAELYVEQGLLDDAVAIYKKLYDSRKEERFLSKIEELKQVIVNQKKIQVLNELLEHIKQKGEKIV